jgi:hypothetical protein
MIDDRSFHVLETVPSRLEVSSQRPRRRWSAEAKARLVEETLQAGANVSAIVRQAGMSPSQLFGWRRKTIYRAKNADMALARLEEFEAECGKRYPAIGTGLCRAVLRLRPSIRKMIYITNAVEALHRPLRKIIKTRGSFPNDDAALKLLYLAIKNAGLRWRAPSNGPAR